MQNTRGFFPKGGCMRAQELFTAFVDAARRLRRNFRWGHFETYATLPDSIRETTLEHSVHTFFLTLYMLELEEKFGRFKGKLNHKRLLVAALIHDLGEGTCGDVKYAVKNDPRVRELLGQIEREEVVAIFQRIPEEARAVLQDAYAIVDAKSLEGRFFNAVERLGYILDAHPQIENGDDAFVDVYERQHPKILELEKEFESLRFLYDEFRAKVERLLKIRKDTSALRKEVNSHP